MSRSKKKSINKEKQKHIFFITIQFLSENDQNAVIEKGFVHLKKIKKFGFSNNDTHPFNVFLDKSVTAVCIYPLIHHQIIMKCCIVINILTSFN